MGELKMGIIKDALNCIDLKIKVRAAMPGHKGKIKVDGRHDVTELPGMDNLQNPEGIIEQAEQTAARIYGTDAARFLVNGSSGGNLTMVFSFFEEGDKVLIERNCHKSVYNAILLRKLEPLYLWPEFDEYGNSLPQNADSVRRALEEHPDVRGILLTQPSYKGFVSDIEAIGRLTKERGVYFLLDAAHGAALAGLKEFKDFYSSCDVMVVSAHKSLGCLNQGAVILLNRPEFRSRILKYSNMFQTTSPSYLILESIESSLEDVEAGLYLDPPDFCAANCQNLIINPIAAGLRRDPWKLLIHHEGKGAWMEDFLEEHGIYPEMHDRDSVLLMLSPFNPPAELDYLKDVLKKLDEAAGNMETQDGNPKKGFYHQRHEHPLPPKTMILPHLVGEDYAEYDLDKAIGHTAQEQVIPYPPGVPILVPGEEIDADMVEYIRQLQRDEVEILGLYDNKLRCLKGDS